MKTSQSIASRLSALDNSKPSSKLLLASQLENLLYSKSSTVEEYEKGIEKRISKMASSVVINDMKDSEFRFLLKDGAALGCGISERFVKSGSDDSGEAASAGTEVYVKVS